MQIGKCLIFWNIVNCIPKSDKILNEKFKEGGGGYNKLVCTHEGGVLQNVRVRIRWGGRGHLLQKTAYVLNG